MDWDEENAGEMCKLDQELETAVAREGRRPEKVGRGVDRPKCKTSTDNMGTTT